MKGCNWVSGVLVALFFCSVSFADTQKKLRCVDAEKGEDNALILIEPIGAVNPGLKMTATGDQLYGQKDRSSEICLLKSSEDVGVYSVNGQNKLGNFYSCFGPTWYFQFVFPSEKNLKNLESEVTFKTLLSYLDMGQSGLVGGHVNLICSQW